MIEPFETRKILLNIKSKLSLLMLIIPGLIFNSNLASAQKERNVWYFGFEAGIDFNSGAPVALTDGKLSTEEGCATICNRRGDLLFYTDGGKIWNRKHNVMPNGDGLKGNLSSTQSAVVVKKPGSTQLYYVFTVDDIGGTDGLRYSIVDMTLDSGLGDVTSTKNVMVMSPTCEKIAVVRHSNNTDYWIITHNLNDTKFSAFTLSSSGMSTTPVVSNIGKSITGVQYGYIVGYLKASPDGKMLACATYDRDYLLLTDFDASTGKLSNGRNLNTGGNSGQRIYGVEFSSSSRYLYASQILTPHKIVQFDLAKSTESAIQNSMVVVKQYNQNVGALQMGPDNKIYITYEKCDYLLCINYPDSPGSQCGFVDSAVYLGGKQGDFGLPTFISSVRSEISYDSFCPGEYTQFHVNVSEMDSVRWNFGDPVSGTANNTSTLMEPTHKFSSIGTFNVFVVIFYSGVSDTLKVDVVVKQIIKPDLGNDTTICRSEKIILNASPAIGPFIWSNGSSDATLEVTDSGTYIVKADVGICQNRDTVVVHIYNPKHVDLGKDTSMCEGDSIYLNALPNTGPYLWSDGSTSSGIFVKTTTQIWVKTIDGNCSTSDTIVIVVYKQPTIELGEDTIICDTNQFLITAKGFYDEVLWEDGSTNSILRVSNNGTYHATAQIAKCLAKDSVKVEFGVKAELELSDSTALCEGEFIELSARSENSEYEWQDGSKSEILRIANAGKYWVTVTNNCGNFSDTTVVYEISCNCFVFVPNVFTPDHDGINDQYCLDGFAPGCETFHLYIYSRWGELVFDSDDVHECWDGSVHNSNRKCPPGTYFYLLDIFNGNSKSNDRISGTVTLISGKN
ncbi:MAG: T9SS type B sorting domain-containing protein [Bacteroidetes bacterium]|nr:T9SS type B sorting domain-containing protein [Bacteroidota bacterium]